MKSAVVSILGAVFLLSAESSLGTLAIIDQKDGGNGNQGPVSFSIGTGLGQSFTPNLTSMNGADFILAAFPPATIRLDIFTGSGYAGSLLASSQPVTFTGTSQTFVEFTFSSLVTLIPGTPYTFRLTLLAAPNGYVAYGSSENPYAGGNAWDTNGNAVLANDFMFAEGIVAIIPEPGTSGLLLFGAVAILWRVVKGISWGSRQD